MRVEEKQRRLRNHRKSWETDQANEPEEHPESVRKGPRMSLPCCKRFIAPLCIEGYMFLRMSYCECEQSATPQPHMTQLAGRMGGEPETRRREWWADRSASLPELELYIAGVTAWAWASSFKLVKVCFNSEQTRGFGKHHLNSPPPKLEWSRTNPELRGFIVRPCLNRLLELWSDRLGYSCHEKRANLEPPSHMKAESTLHHKYWPKIQF